MEDSELVARARAGDRACLEALWARHRGRVEAVARRLLGDDEAVAEVSQEVAIVALTDLSGLRQPQLVGAWLAGIARNLALRQLRHRRRSGWSWEAVHGGRLPQLWRDDEPGPDELALRAELAADVRRAVARLPDGQRDAVELFYLEDHTHREVAETLGIDVNAVKARLHRARHSLRPLIPPATGATRRSEHEELTMGDTNRIEMRVRDVRRRTYDGEEQHVVLLDSADNSELAIWLGATEAIALALRLDGVETPRPFTYDTMSSLVSAAGGEVTEVELTRLESGTYFAEASVERGGDVARVDVRPSDGLNLALVVGARIVARRNVLAAASEAARSDRHPDDVTRAFPDDASTIAGEIRSQWERHLNAIREERR